MEKMSHPILNAHIELSGIWGRVVRVLELAHNTVAIGMTAADHLNDDWLRLPSDAIQMQYSSGRTISLDEMKVYWRNWILTAGFREVAEIISETLEEIHKVLSLWALLPEGAGAQSGLVSIKRYQQMEEENRQFHKRNLPDKFDWLATKYEFSFPLDSRAELLSINAARNCLVHRSGVIGSVDLDDRSEKFVLRWRSLRGYLRDSSGERPLKFPFTTPETESTSLLIKVEATEKSFSRGERLELTADEFSGIAWTQLSVSQWAASRLEEIGRARGFEIGASRLIEQPPAS